MKEGIILSINDLKDEYLLNMGCSIADRYDYLSDQGYSYFQNRDDGFAVFGTHRAPLNTRLLDAHRFQCTLNGAQSSFANSVTNQAKDALSGSSTSAVVDVCSQALDAAKSFFADFIKFSVKHLPMDEATLQKMMILIDSSVRSLGEGFSAVLKKHNISVSEAIADAANFQNRCIAETIAEAAAAPTYTYGTTRFSDSLTGTHAYTTTYTSSTMSQQKIDSAMTAHATVSRMWEETRVESANKEALSEISATIDRVIQRFYSTFKELVSLKAPDLIRAAIDYSSSDLSVNPTNTAVIYQAVGTLADSEFAEVKKLLDYYGLSISRRLNIELGEKIFNYYKENGTFDYDSPYLRFYRFVWEGPEEFYVEQAQTRVYNDLKHAAKEIFQTVELRRFRSQLLDESREKVRNCPYITQEDKDSLFRYIEGSCDNFVQGKKEGKKKRLKDLIKSTVILFVIAAILVVMAPEVQASNVIPYLIIVPIIITLFRFAVLFIRWRD